MVGFWLHDWMMNSIILFIGKKATPTKKISRICGVSYYNRDGGALQTVNGSWNKPNLTPNTKKYTCSRWYTDFEKRTRVVSLLPAVLRHRQRNIFKTSSSVGLEGCKRWSGVSRFSQDLLSETVCVCLRNCSF